MGRVRFLIILLALGCLAFAASAPAASSVTRKAPKSYVPKKGKPCKKGYRSVKRRHKRICVRRHRKRATATQSPPQFQVQLDSVSRDPLNPFKVTYGFHAAATRATASGEEPIVLPAGVVSLFADGKLECALNLGGANASASCPVVHAALGDHQITLVYTSGEASVTSTRTEGIEPIQTSTALSANFRSATPAAIESGLSGYLDITADVLPAGTAMVGCLGGDPPDCIDFIPSFYGGCCGHTGYTFPLDGVRTFPVHVRDERFGICFNQPAWEITVGDADGETLALGLDSGSASGELLARSSVGKGYLNSGATAAVQFTPSLPPDPCADRYGQLTFSYSDVSDEPPTYEGGSTRVGTVQVLRDPDPMRVWCSESDAIGGKPECIPAEVDELAVYVSDANQNDCVQLQFESETDPGVYFTRFRSEVESGAYFYGFAWEDDKWATGVMDFQPLLPTACSG